MINEFNRPKRDAIYEMIRSHLPSEECRLRCVMILIKVPILLLDEGPDSVHVRAGQGGLKLIELIDHRPAFAARHHGVVVAISSRFSPTRAVNVLESLSYLLDTLVSEAALEGVGSDLIFTLRPRVGDGSAQDYAKRADGLFDLPDEVVGVSHSRGQTLFSVR